MTEAEWVQSSDPTMMLVSVSNPANERRFRLFAIACIEQQCDLTDEPREMQSLIVARMWADGLTAEKERSEAEQKLMDVRDEREAKYGGDWYVLSDLPLYILYPKFAVDDAIDCAQTIAERARYSAAIQGIVEDICSEQSNLLRDIFGNPFRPMTFDPRWRTSDVVGLARAIYDDKAFERMPILADALMDAGCEDEQIIGHCRGEGPHVRGCWVVDLVLGKE